MSYSENSLKYLKNSSSDKKEYYLFNKIPFILKDPLPIYVEIENVISNINRSIPEHLFYEIDSIFIGQFPELEQRDVKAAYLDGAIYTTNVQKSDVDLFDDIVHEVAHSLEKPKYLEIYGDDLIELEYLGKKRRLLDILKARGYNIDSSAYTTVKYDKQFDEFLYFDLGFKKLENFTNGLFVTPYSVTSISEYFSEGFENFFLKDKKYLNKISPELFKKVKFLSEPETEY